MWGGVGDEGEWMEVSVGVSELKDNDKLHNGIKKISLSMSISVSVYVPGAN